MSADESISAKLGKPFPREAIKQRQGGGNTRLSYVEGHTVIRRLIEATGNQFDLRILSLEYKGDLLTAMVELTIPGLGSRQHIGVQKVTERGGEDLVKGAVTDALKKAATLFGVGLELYGPDYESDDQPAARPQAAPAPRSAPERTTAVPAPYQPNPPKRTDVELLAIIGDPATLDTRRENAAKLYLSRATDAFDAEERAAKLRPMSWLDTRAIAGWRDLALAALRDREAATAAG